ncbi:Surface polysaccharide O-acyltransferase, integral membrane enzyme [Carboxydocella thermautotrophica]|nr:Surface polysaccharide O-acyltransferase, integral membrane enzyme [Carboxydocella thermautotrophica]
MTTDRERIAELDILRGVAFLGVVLQHAIGIFIRKLDIYQEAALILGLLFNLVKFAVPMFVFISGVGLLYNYYEQLDYAGFIKKRSREILFPYLFWSLLYYYHYYEKLPLDSPGLIRFMQQLATGSAAYHLWFVVMIFQVYLFYPLILPIYRWLRPRVQSYKSLYIILGMAALLYTALMGFSAYIVPGGYFKFESSLLQLIFIKYRSINFLYYSFYFVLGSLAAFALVKWRDLVLRTLAGNSVAFAGLFLWISLELLQGARNGVVNLAISTSLKPSMFFYTVSSILLIYGLALLVTKYNPLLQQILNGIGRYSFGAYLVHALALDYIVKQLTWATPSNYLEMTLISFGLTAVVSFLLAYLSQYVPFGKLVMGNGSRGRIELLQKGTLFR